MTSPHQIASQILAGTHQITQRLELGRWHQHRTQLTSRVQPRELQRIARIGLDPITGLARDRTGAQTISSTPAASRARASSNPVGPAS